MLWRSLCLMIAPKEKEEILSPTEALWGHSCHIYLQIAPPLTSLTLVAARKANTASVNLSSDSRSLIDVLLGLALACLTLNPKPFLLLKGSLVLLLSPEASPTALHSSLISFVHAVHSLKRNVEGGLRGAAPETRGHITAEFSRI